MTFEQFALTCIGALIIACIGTCALIWHIAYHDGYHDGRAAEKDRQARRRFRDTRSDAVIASKTAPRAPWYVTVEAVQHPRPARYMTAVPVLTPRELAAAHGDTIPFSQRRATDTGELRALAAGADLIIDRITADGDAWRQQFTQAAR